MSSVFGWAGSHRAGETAGLVRSAPAHGHDLPLSQARVFQRIAPDGSRLSELAQAAQVSKQTIGSVVDQLERAGYVSRVPDPTDARARLVVVTDLGRELVELSLPVVREIESAWRAHLGAARTRELRRTLVARERSPINFAVPMVADLVGALERACSDPKMKLITAPWTAGRGLG